VADDDWLEHIYSEHLCMNLDNISEMIQLLTSRYGAWYDLRDELNLLSFELTMQRTSVKEDGTVLQLRDYIKE